MESTNQKTWRAALAALCMLGILAFAAHCIGDGDDRDPLRAADARV